MSEHKSNGISFRINTRDPEPSFYNIERPTDYYMNSYRRRQTTRDPFVAMYRIIDMSRMIHPMHYVDLNDILSRSMEESGITRQNISIVVSSEEYKDVKNQLNNHNCSICLNEYDDEDKVSILICNHVFHTDCIKEWGCHKPECPLCKQPIPYNDNL